MNKYILIILSFFVFGCGKSQELDSADILSRHKASNLIKKHFVKEISNKQHLLFSIKDEWYLIITKGKEKNKIEEYYVRLDSLNNIVSSKKTIIEKPEKFIKKAFNKNLYNKDFINLNSDFYKLGYEISSGNPTYFYFMDSEGNLYGESKLTTLIKPNPVDSKVYNHLMVRALSYVDDNGTK